MSIRWGIIGCGDVCEVKSGPPLYRSPGSALSVVMRRDPARASDFARRHGVPRHTTCADEVIDADDVDAVYVATPPGSHLRYALRVAAAGKPCYVEKPMARSEAECRRMLAAFERARQPLFVAYYRRALPRFIQVRELLASGAIGSLACVSHTYQGRAPAPDAAPRPRSWRERAAHSGGGLFLDLGSHVVDLLDQLLGPLSGVTGRAARRSTAPAPGLVEDTVVASFRAGSGVLGSLRYQFHTADAVDRLEFVGSEGSLSLSVFGQEPIQLRTRAGTQSLAAPNPPHVQMPLVESIVGQLLGRGVECPSTGESALRASRVMDQVLGEYYGGRDDEFWRRPESWPGVAPLSPETRGSDPSH